MAKLCLKKKSKRTPAKLRYKIEKKVRDHNRKLRRDAKKNPKHTKKPKSISIPNLCPFKDDILKNVEAFCQQKKEEEMKHRVQLQEERSKIKQTQNKPHSLTDLVSIAESKDSIHQNLTPTAEQTADLNKNQQNSLKAYYKEFRKVIDAADVVLEVVDARDPQGTRCLQVEEAVRESPGNKRLVIVINKADLIPRGILDQWLKYLRQSAPTIAFKASTQLQNRRLGRKKFAQTNAKAIQNSTCVGAEMLMSILANYCRNKGIKTSIRVGVVGLPNVGKSSLINSLKRSRACNVGATPGITKMMQEVQLDAKIKLLDSPGIVFAKGDDCSSSLRNAVKVTLLSDPITPANAILQRVTKQQMMDMYDINEYSTPDEFYCLKAARMGRFKRGGIPDQAAAARGLVEDWNNGKIKYYTVPPEENREGVHISSEIVQQVAAEFNIEEFGAMESNVMDQLEKEGKGEENGFQLESLGFVNVEEKMEEDKPAEKKSLLSENVKVKAVKKQIKGVEKMRKKKVDPEMELEGNLQINKVKKQQFKKAKKGRNRLAKEQLQQAVDELNSTKDYDFDEDFQMK